MTEGDHPDWKGSAVTNNAETVRPTRRAQREVRLPRQAAGEAPRRARDRQLAIGERLERVHRLCAQMASVKPVRQPRAG